MTPCVFCTIPAGRAEASFVYRDASMAAFMSLEQPNPYKVLVVPTAHVETLYDLTDAQTADSGRSQGCAGCPARLGL